MNELRVSLENIIPLTFARDHFSQIVSEVQQDKLFVLTKGGKPAVAIIDVKYLESITGGQIQKADIKEEIKKAPEKVGLPPMVEHPPTEPGPMPPKPTSPPPAPKPTPPPPPPPPPKPFDKPPSTPLGTSQGKPAGFAAPSFAKATEGRPQPQPKPAPSPKPSPPPPPPIPKPEPKPAPLPPPPPKPAPAKGPGLVMPEEKKEETSGIPNKPLKTLPPVGQTNQVNVEFAPDETTLAKQTAEDKIPDIEKAAPDDKNPPAQYAGEEENPPAGGEPEPEDMALD